MPEKTTQTYTWLHLNRRLMGLSNEKLVLHLFEQQKALPLEYWENPETRERWLGRIWSRYVRLRSKRERLEMNR